MNSAAEKDCRVNPAIIYRLPSGATYRIVQRNDGWRSGLAELEDGLERQWIDVESDGSPKRHPEFYHPRAKSTLFLTGMVEAYERARRLSAHQRVKSPCNAWEHNAFKTELERRAASERTT